MDIIKIDIKWHDAKALGGAWEEVDHLVHTNPEYCLTRGFLINEDEDCYRIAQTIGEGGYLNAIVVPKGCVKKIKVEKDGSELV